MSRFLLAAALAAASASASAQADGAAARTIEYRSTFEGYRGWSAQPLRNWREVNDEVERLGGHAGHLRGDSAAPEQKSPTPPAQTQPPTMPRGSGHDGGASPAQQR